ncbi:Ioc4p NDAI_0B01270 [Naumovozyma dairenensis CBS 421]|uniref:PWWP domain-containing protein n=1 Tax=Naumovozyma dairenensis (strain ATCC 10597 / BCRC 20456 / CBS 421 / NBRC 0211 / NRRL Y-12639) TaxID=1071378 RepID=G0W5V0_NAUDC|nr:hypothetical protein NDAI_0B01270 [Naumovozyma dairenensis CBS 421]CCD23161.1 hypothetical protein NDAI_0B01270 [Naumovozyma dairenensis CBS 421]
MMIEEEQHIYQPTDIVLAKVKGFSAWPAMIVPTELIPEHILRTNTHTDEESETEDNTDTQDADDTKFIHYSKLLKFRKFEQLKNSYCVKFFCDDSYIWVKPSDLKLLTVEQCREWLKSTNKKKKNKKLIPAYEMASKGSDNIDVWEFIEYGSYGKPDDDEYVEEQEEEQEEQEEEEEVPKTTASIRSTRSRNKKTIAKKVMTKPKPRTRSKHVVKEEKQVEPVEKGEEEEQLEEVLPKKRRGRPASKSATKTTTKKQKLKVKEESPKIEEYNYEDDEDWALVGLGPQDVTIQDNVSSVVKKLSQKQNMEKHWDQRLNIIDKIAGINKMMLTLINSIISEESGKTQPVRDDYELLLDELDQALSMRGAKTEFITIFQWNTELLLNLRAIMSLKYLQLIDWDIFDQFQAFFRIIFKYDLILDQTEWKYGEKEEEKETTTIPNGGVNNAEVAV